MQDSALSPECIIAHTAHLIRLVSVARSNPNTSQARKDHREVNTCWQRAARCRGEALIRRHDGFINNWYSCYSPHRVHVSRLPANSSAITNITYCAEWCYKIAVRNESLNSQLTLSKEFHFLGIRIQEDNEVILKAVPISLTLTLSCVGPVLQPLWTCRFGFRAVWQRTDPKFIH